MRSLLRCSLALLLLLGVACSSDSKDSASKDTTSTTTTTIRSLGADEVDAKASPYCATWGEIRAMGAPAVTGDAEKDDAVRKAFYAKVLPLAEKLASQADSSIKEAAEGALAQVRAAAEDGSNEAFTAKGASERQQELAQYALEHCAK